MKYRPLKYAMGVFLLGGYLFLSVFSLIHMGHMAEKGMAMDECPYLLLRHDGGSGLLDHTASWHVLVNILLPSIFFLLFLVGLVVFRGIPLSLSYDPSCLKWWHLRLPPKLFVLLFSQGILNPQAP